MIKIPTKYYVYIILALSLVYAAFMTSEMQSQKDRADRMTDNYSEMKKDNRLIRLEMNEFKKTMDEKTDSILKVANIKPKWVREVHTVTNNYHITKPVEVLPEQPVVENDTVKYPFNEKIDCMTIEGFMTVDTLKVPHLYLTSGTGYENKTTSIVYERRQQWKLWFIKTRLFGKRKYELHTESDCGNVKTEVIKVQKK